VTPEDDLRSQRDTLLQQLRDLEDEHAAGDLTDADYRSLKDDYTARAAAVIRQLQAIAGGGGGDGGGGAAADGSSAVDGGFARDPQADEAGAPAARAPVAEAGTPGAGSQANEAAASAAGPSAGASVAAAGALGGGSQANDVAAPAVGASVAAAGGPGGGGSDVIEALVPAADGAPGDALGADLRGTDASATQTSHGRRRKRRVRTAAVVALLAMLSGGIGYGVAQSSGERLEGEQASGDIPETGVDRITKAQVLVSEGKVLDAVKVYDEVLEDDPENPVALAQRGWLISRVDQRLVDDGLAQVDQAIELDPTFADAHFFRGMILLRGKAQPQAAAEAFQRAIDAKPDPELLGIIQQFKAEAETAAAEATTPSTTP
jgi:tetratricopeptide (TPR) repeat protein